MIHLARYCQFLYFTKTEHEEQPLFETSVFNGHRN